MNPIEITVNGVKWPQIHIPFIEVPIEESSDITTMNGTLYTHFTNKRRAWKLHWEVITSDEWATIRTAYNLQFSSGDYATVEIPFYSVNKKMRISINELDIRSFGHKIESVDVILTEQEAI